MKYSILHLGAGVQSSAIYCLMADGEIPSADYALFADTQEEPSWVYDQLEILKKIDGPEIICVTAGKIGDDLMNGMNSTGQRFASIPAHTTYVEGVKGGLTRRQCTREYKIDPIDKWVRRDLLELKPRQRLPNDVRLISYFGFSTDESNRAFRMQKQFSRYGDKWRCEFPLFFDDIMMTRRDARIYVEKRTGVEWRSSRCVFCPLQNNSHWREIKEHDESGWKRAVEVDIGLRTDGAVANRDMREIMYVHKSCTPLEASSLDSGQGVLFEDDGGCDQGCFL